MSLLQLVAVCGLVTLVCAQLPSDIASYSDAEKLELLKTFNETGTEAGVSFKVGRTTEFGPVPEDFTIPFDYVEYNKGGGFDAFSSHFFAVVPGVYLITASVLGNSIATAQIIKEQQPVSHFKSYHGSASSSVIVDLDFLQSVWVVLTMSDDSQITCHDSGNECTFSGVLLHERSAWKVAAKN